MLETVWLVRNNRGRAWSVYASEYKHLADEQAAEIGGEVEAWGLERGYVVALANGADPAMLGL